MQNKEQKSIKKHEYYIKRREHILNRERNRYIKNKSIIKNKGLERRVKMSGNCKDCGKKLRFQKAVRCKSCAGKINNKNKVHPKGEFSTNWKGGKTSPIRLIQQSNQYQNWRKSIYARDKYTCRKCGANKCEIHAHHKKLFSKLLREAQYKSPILRLYEAAMCYEPLWDIGNGITLCVKCHRKEKHHGKRKIIV